MPRQNISPVDYPQAVLQQIEQLGQHIAIARKRRGETQTQWARRLGVSQPTMARIERGDPSVAMASYVMCMWLVNPAVAVADLVAPQNDHAALEREVFKARQTRNKAKKQANDGGLTASEDMEEHSLSAATKIPPAAMHGKHHAQSLGKVAEATPRSGVFAQFSGMPVSAVEELWSRELARNSPVDFSKSSGLDGYENELERLNKSLTGGSSGRTAEEFAKLSWPSSGEDELDKLRKSFAGGSVASAAEEFAKLGVLSSGEKELEKLRKSLAGGSVANAAEEFAKLSAVGPGGETLEKLRKSFAGGSVASAAEEFAKLSALNLHEDEFEKLKRSSVGGAVADGLAALLLKRHSGLK